MDSELLLRAAEQQRHKERLHSIVKRSRAALGCVAEQVGVQLTLCLNGVYPGKRKILIQRALQVLRPLSGSCMSKV
jgi:hypothetical protein